MKVAGSGLSILYVDDDDDIRTIVAMSLQLDPAIDLHMAASKQEALALLDRRAGWTPDVVLLDVMMPGLSGPATWVRMRERPGFARVPVLFMTARGRPVEVSEYRELGAAGTILKPFDPIHLAAQIRHLVSATSS